MASGQYDSDSDAIYGNSDAVLFHSLITSGGFIGSVNKHGDYNVDNNNSNEEETELYDYDDFTSDEEETEDGGLQEIQPEEVENVQVQEETNQGDSCNEEAQYLIPLPSKPKSICPKLPNRWPPCPPQQHPCINSSPLSEDCLGPRKPYPTSTKMDSAMNSVFPRPQNNGRPGSPLGDHVKRTPLPVPVQKNSHNKLEHARTDKTDTSGKSSPDHCKPFLQNRNAPLKVPLVSTETNLPLIKLENGEQILLNTLYQNLMEKSYFHLVSRDYAKNLVMKGGDGAFLIRPSTKSDKPLTITVYSGCHHYHVNIRQRPDNCFALGSQQSNEKAFSTIDEIVSTHHVEPIILSNGASFVLKYSPMKTRNIYVQHTIHGHKGNQ